MIMPLHAAHTLVGSNGAEGTALGAAQSLYLIAFSWEYRCVR